MAEIILTVFFYTVITIFVLSLLSVAFAPLLLIAYSLIIGDKDTARGAVILSIIFYVPTILLTYAVANL